MRILRVLIARAPKKALTVLLAFCLVPCTVVATEESIGDRVTHHRAIEAAVWAMPLMNYKFYRDALVDAGVDRNDIGYYSKIQNWKFQTATPNNTTPYIMTHWSLADGPIVVEIPAAEDGVGIFGTLMDAWQRPLEDVGALGRDKGQGAKYLLVPENYNGPLIPNALVYTHRTNNGFAVLRPIIKGATPENLAKAAKYVRKIKIYPLGQKAKTNYVDLYDLHLEMTPKLDEGIYRHIHEFINEEPVEDMNLAMMGMLKHIGIEKDAPFEPAQDLKKVYAKAAPEALEYMIEQYHRDLTPWKYEGKKWSELIPSGGAETEWTYEFPSYFDYTAKGALYYAIITSIKNYGTATYYLDIAETEDGEWLHGKNNYKLTMPANVPVKNFWSITTYDLETASYLRDLSPSSIDSLTKTVKTNSDGTVDIYFGPKAPKGNESNWLPTNPQRRFFLLARFYGPDASIINGAFKLNSVVRAK